MLIGLLKAKEVALLFSDSEFPIAVLFQCAMEKEEELNFASAPNLQHDANGVLRKNERSVPDATDASENAKSECRSLQNAARQNQQYTAILQRALDPQHAGEKSTSSSAAALNEPIQPPPQFVLSSQPFWLQPRADGFAGFQPQAPNFGYPVGYPTYSGFPASWEPSIWWGQSQPLFFPGMSNYPRPSYGFVSSQSWPMPVSSCVTSSSSGQPLLRGVIKPPEKLSQKHRRLWEAQSVENFQLWNMIGQLQGELADCKGRLIKLEAEISSFRSAAMEEPAVKVGNGGIVVRGQPAKRGRPKRTIAPVGSQLPSELRARGRKPAIGRTREEEANPTVLEKESLNKVDDKYKDFSSLGTTEQDRNEGASATITQNNGAVETDDGTLKIPASLGNQVLQQFPEIESMSLLKSNYEGIISEDSERNTSSIACPTFYTNENIIVSRQGITRLNFEGEEDAAESGFAAV